VTEIETRWVPESLDSAAQPSLREGEKEHRAASLGMTE